MSQSLSFRQRQLTLTQTTSAHKVQCELVFGEAAVWIMSFNLKHERLNERWEKRKEVQTRTVNNRNWTHHRGQLIVPPLQVPHGPRPLPAESPPDIHWRTKQESPIASLQTDWLCMVCITHANTHTHTLNTQIHTCIHTQVYRQYRNSPRLGYYHTHSMSSTYITLLQHCMALTHAVIYKERWALVASLWLFSLIYLPPSSSFQPIRPRLIALICNLLSFSLISFTPLFLSF